MSEEPDLEPTRHAIPPRTDAIRLELECGDRELMHCLECAFQFVALRHGDACLACGSAAVVVEAWD